MRLLLPPLLEDNLVLVDLIACPKVATVILVPPALDTVNPGTVWETDPVQENRLEDVVIQRR
jgi:hypothetical protein